MAMKSVQSLTTIPWLNNAFINHIKESRLHLLYCTLVHTVVGD